jgi:DNA-binding NarL/FixJ family response regulator
VVDGVARGALPSSPKVMVVDDHALLAQSLSLALTASAMEVVPCTDLSLDGIRAAAEAARPDLVLLDLDLGPGRGDTLPVIPGLVEDGATVVMLTGVTDPVRLALCIEAGVAGVIDKADPFDQLVDQIRTVVDRGTLLDEHQRQERLALLRNHRRDLRERLGSFEELTPREAHVLAALMDGRSAEQIAQDDFVSITTVRTHIRAMMGKLGVRSQLAAVALARRAGWVPQAD